MTRSQDTLCNGIEYVEVVERREPLRWGFEEGATSVGRRKILVDPYLGGK